MTTAGQRPPGATLTMRGGGSASDRALGEGGFLLVLESSTSTLVSVPWEGELIIGRTPESLVRVRSPAVSRSHARVAVQAGEVFVSDLGSHNGTYVNGERVRAARRLASGDVIALCDVTVVFYSPAPRSGTRPLYEEVGYLHERLEEEIDRAARSMRPLSLMAIESAALLDRTQVASAVAGLLRLCDVVAMDGPQRLLVLQPESDEREAAQAGKRLIEALTAAGIETKAGYAVYPGDGPDSAALLEGARTAATLAERRQVLGAATAVSTLVIGDRRLLLADPTMMKLYGLIKRLAPSDLTTLIYGETGTGKELAAQALHTLSPRSKERMLGLNCAALTESLAESELFGHERGAFSGAVTSKPGLLESAQGGTVFLDEVGELSLAIQAKLLRALESRKLLRVGDVRERSFTARVVAATNRDLEQEVARGRFRQDLYFRLSSAVLHLPPLRARPRELLLLAREFLSETRTRLGQPKAVLAPATLDLLVRYRWPGNVRELKNAMEYAAAVVTDDVIEPEHLPAPLRTLASERHESTALDNEEALARMARALLRMPAGANLDTIEDALIAEALRMADGNKSAAARLLGVHRKVIERRLARPRSPKEAKDPRNSDKDDDDE